MGGRILLPDLAIAVATVLVGTTAVIIWGQVSISTIQLAFPVAWVISGLGVAWIAARKGRVRGEVLGWFLAGIVLLWFALIPVLIVRPRAARADLRP